MIAAGEVCIGWEDARDVLENSGALLKVPQFGDGHAYVLGIRAAKVVVDSDELLRPLKR